MNDLYHVILYILLTAAILSLFTGYLLFRRRKTPGALFYGLTAFSTAIWCLGYIIEFTANTIEFKFFGVQIQYLLGIPFVSVLWLSAALHYTKLGQRPTITEFILINIIPTITMILIWTNDAHHLVYESMSLYRSDSFLLIEKKVGIWYYINVIYSYFGLLLGTIILLLAVKRSKDIYRSQIYLFLIAALLPWIANILYLIGMNSFMRVDITPVAFSISLLLIGFAIRRYGLFDIVPAAHSRVVASMNNGLIVLDSSERVVEINPAMRSLLWDSNVIGKQARDVFNENDIDLAILDSGTDRIEIKRNKQVFDTTISDVTDKGGNVAARVINLYDITDLKNAEEELRELNTAKDKLFSIIAHDLKNPFFGIIGLTEILYEDYNEMNDEDKRKMLKDINELANNTYQILENLLTWSQQQTGKMEFEPREIDINTIIDDNIEAIKHQAKLKNIRLSQTLCDENIVYADSNMTNTVIRNLLSNALKFSMPGGKIQIETSLKDNMIQVAIMDNGVGMNEKTKQKLFRIDQTIKSTGTMGEKGTGLGLILCKDFVEKNGGTITVESEPGKGSKFIFTLKKST